MSLSNLLLSLETPNGVQSVAYQSKNTKATSKGTEQTVRMHMLFGGFAGRTYHIVAELSETQNYAYWYARFFPGTHDFR